MVVDASAAIEWLLRTQKGSVVEKHMFAAGQSLNAPHLIDIEVTQVLRRYVRERALTEARAEERLQSLLDLQILRHSHTFLLRRAWQLRHHLTIYDAVYVALAEALDAPLLTCDAKLATAPNHYAIVELV